MTNSAAARTIAAVFGLVFVLVNAGHASDPWHIVLRVLGVLAFAAFAVALVRSAHPPLHPRAAAIRVYWVSVALEVVAVVAGARVLNHYGHGDYVIAWVAFVVGVHFLPFEWAWRMPRFRLLGAAMIALAAVGFVLGVAGAGAAAMALTAGVGSGFALLGFAAAAPRGAPVRP